MTKINLKLRKLQTKRENKIVRRLNKRVHISILAYFRDEENCIK